MDLFDINLLCKRELETIQTALHLNPTELQFRNQEMVARVHYTSLLAQEEKFVRQKSRQLWLQAGDSNTKIFYNSIKSRTVRDTICRLHNTDGSFCSEREEIKGQTLKFYQDLLNRDSFTDISLPLPMGLVTPAVTEVELHKAISCMKALSSSGPDGFPKKFYQLFWSLINEDLLPVVNFFFLKGNLLRQIGHSFISLIPKSLNADSLDSYRSISLCNTFYKIITKIMAQRLQPLLPNLVSSHQSAFIKGRSIHHNILLAHELIKYLNQGKARACIKVDLKKAFDSANWSYLEKILRRSGFNDH
ncbi:hypothetical protein QJS04_geneDACA020256 [Acorus gramineus]|uniref:Reverse transcriptase domain-containing protein n=1 Tax=Acorus gramineus TaxID=55184 RepID=A0AAV9A406_ACOGR|nr:hypothetical protein QJS04_geneDACA020256 [Acorus gramineus]